MLKESKEVEAWGALCPGHAGSEVVEAWGALCPGHARSLHSGVPSCCGSLQETCTGSSQSAFQPGRRRGAPFPTLAEGLPTVSDY